MKLWFLSWLINIPFNKGSRYLVINSISLISWFDNGSAGSLSTLRKAMIEISMYFDWVAINNTYYAKKMSNTFVSRSSAASYSWNICHFIFFGLNLQLSTVDKFVKSASNYLTFYRSLLSSHFPVLPQGVCLLSLPYLNIHFLNPCDNKPNLQFQ